MNNKVEEDKRLSKHNHVFRRGYFIETTLLEKRLKFDYSKKTDYGNAHATKYL